MKWKLIIIGVLIMFSIVLPSLSANEFGYNNINRPTLTTPISNTTLGVNASQFAEIWITTDGNLDNTQDIINLGGVNALDINVSNRLTVSDRFQQLGANVWTNANNGFSITTPGFGDRIAISLTGGDSYMHMKDDAGNRDIYLRADGDGWYQDDFNFFSDINVSGNSDFYEPINVYTSTAGVVNTQTWWDDANTVTATLGKDVNDNANFDLKSGNGISLVHIDTNGDNWFWGGKTAFGHDAPKEDVDIDGNASISTYLGIGMTPSGARPLDLNGGVAGHYFTPADVVTYNLANSAQQGFLQLYSSGALKTQLLAGTGSYFIDPVGVGSSSLTHTFNVNGDSRFNGNITIANQANQGIAMGATSILSFGDTYGVIRANDDLYIDIDQTNSGAESLFIRGNGASVPIANFPDTGGFTLTTGDQTITAGRLIVTDDAANNVAQFHQDNTGGDGVYIFSDATANSRYVLYTAGNAGATIGLVVSADGTHGFGTATPTLLIDGIAPSANLGAVRVEGTTANSALKMQVVDTDGGKGYMGTEDNKELNIIQNNNVAINIDTNRNIGIGTTSQTYDLEVRGADGDVTIFSALNADGSGGFITGTDAGDQHGFLQLDRTGGATGVFLDSDNTGVSYVESKFGTGRSPISELDVYGTDGATYGFFDTNAVDTDAGISFRENSVGKWWIYNDGDDNDVLKFETAAGVNKASISQAGEFGATGTHEAGYSITSNGQMLINGGTGHYLWFEDSGGTPRTGIGYLLDGADDVMQFGGGAWEKVRFTVNGGTNMVILDSSGADFSQGNNFYPYIQPARDNTNVGYSFAGDLDTGMYHPNTNHELRLAVQGKDLVSMKQDLFNVSGNFTGNNFYGELWGHDIGDIPLPASSTYINITNVTEGNINGFTSFNGSLSPIVAGLYSINSAWSFSGTANNEYHLALGVNSVRNTMCHAERVIGTGADVGSASFTCLVRLTTADDVTVMIENVDSAGNPTVHDFNLNLIRIGD